MQLTPGSLLQGGKYLINHPLETQGFGVTYRSTQTYHGQPVVIKTLHPALHKSRAFPRLRDRFIDIASILTRSQHPSIVRVIEIFQEGDLPFMVMEYVPGQKLTELVKPGQTMAEIEALHYTRLIGAALTISHRFGLIHGNLKPQNIIRRGGSNVPVLVGYGISPERMLAAVQYAVPGFPHEFNGPEQIGEKGDRLASADIYALAANFYFLLTGHPPLPAVERQNKDLVDQLPLLSLLNPNLQQAIVQGLALNPKQRPKTIDEWLSQLPGSNVPRLGSARPEILPTLERPIHLTTPLLDRRLETIAPTQLEPVSTLQVDPIQTVTEEATRPVFRQAPIEQPTKQPEEKPIEPSQPIARPQFREAPLPTPMPVPAEVVEPIIPLVPNSPSRTEQQVEQQLQQRPIRPYPNLPAPSNTNTWKKMLGLTAAISATIGISFGLALRFSAARSPQGGSMFHAEQSFPERDWKGTLTPQDKGDGPIEDSRPTNNDGVQPASSPKESATLESPSTFSTEPMIEAPRKPAAKFPRSIESEIEAPKIPDRTEIPSPTTKVETPDLASPPRTLPPRQLETPEPTSAEPTPTEPVPKPTVNPSPNFPDRQPSR